VCNHVRDFSALHMHTFFSSFSIFFFWFPLVDFFFLSLAHTSIFWTLHDIYYLTLALFFSMLLSLSQTVFLEVHLCHREHINQGIVSALILSSCISLYLSLHSLQYYYNIIVPYNTIKMRNYLTRINPRSYDSSPYESLHESQVTWTETGLAITCPTVHVVV
jgi:hypothetical protein